MGIAHDDGAQPWMSSSNVTFKNVYWTYDGGSSQLVRFDFRSDHGPGSMDHSFAEVRRYTGLKLSRVPDVPSHMVVDPESRTMFVCDTGADRVLAVEVDSGSYGYDAKTEFPIYSSPSDNFVYSVWHGLAWTVVASVPRPSGVVASRDGAFVYISSYSEGSIYALSRSTKQVVQIVASATPAGLTGLALDATGVLWYTNQESGAIGRIDVTTSCDSGSGTGVASCADGSIGTDGETDVDCGGPRCARCEDAQSCSVDADCEHAACSGGVCGAEAPTMHNGTFLLSYLSSDFFTNSFAHFMLYVGMGGAGYANLYPIMDDDFCTSIGRQREMVEPSSGATPEPVGAFLLDTPVNCSDVDFDSLLLGGCWCHECLPEDPCLNGGTCVNYNTQGYTCTCPSGFSGDHCQTAADGSTTASFVWWTRAGILPSYMDGSNAGKGPSPTIIGVSVGGGVLVVVVTLWATKALWMKGAGEVTSKVTVTKSKSPSAQSV
jgi:hypothetical protein